ncbi:MAG: PIN domain-containing protein [Mobilitalea sp.]
MKNILKECLDLSEEEKNRLWSKSMFVFDTNLLLNLYRYSKETRDALFSALYNLKNRIWIPYHVVEEYYKNRCKIIYETTEKYDKLTKSSDTFIDECRISLNLKNKEVLELKEFIQNWLIKEKTNNLLVIKPAEDAILDNLLNLFDGKAGKNMDQSVLDGILAEGKTRYDNKIPPGYMDSKKINNTNDNNMFGDLIIWKQILEYSKEFQKNIIYVTNDQKEDWWYIECGKTIGPRYELKKEFHDYTGKEFHMYSMESFLTKNNTNTDRRILDEVKYFEDDINQESDNIILSPYNKYRNIFKENEIGIFPECIQKIKLDKDRINTLKNIEGENYEIMKMLDYKRNKLYREQEALNQLKKKYRNSDIPEEIIQQMYEISNSIRKTEYEIIRLSKIEYDLGK